MSQYRKGYRLEQRVRQHLTDDGYIVVRSAGSKTPIDMVAIKPHQLLFVQVKTGEISHDEWNTLLYLADDVLAVPILASRDRKSQIVFERIAAPHRARSHTWPSEPFHSDEVIA